MWTSESNPRNHSDAVTGGSRETAAAITINLTRCSERIWAIEHPGGAGCAQGATCALADATHLSGIAGAGEAGICQDRAGTLDTITLSEGGVGYNRTMEGRKGWELIYLVCAEVEPTSAQVG